MGGIHLGWRAMGTGGGFGRPRRLDRRPPHAQQPVAIKLLMLARRQVRLGSIMRLAYQRIREGVQSHIYARGALSALGRSRGFGVQASACGVLAGLEELEPFRRVWERRTSDGLEDRTTNHDARTYAPGVWSPRFSGPDDHPIAACGSYHAFFWSMAAG